MTSRRKTLAKASDKELCDELLARGWNVSLRRPKWWVHEQKRAQAGSKIEVRSVSMSTKGARAS